MLKKLLTSALFAGFAAGLIAALLQIVFVVPVIAEAELYETGKLVHFGAEAMAGHETTAMAQDWVRNGYTILATTGTYIGFALILIAGMGLAERIGHVPTVRQGLVWGICAFVAAQLAPAMGLPPELPGMAAGDLVARQIWWAGTAVTAALGMAALAFGRDWRAWALGVAFLLAPHIIGAPHPDEFWGTVPPELAAAFAGKALAIGAAGWAALGALAAYFMRSAD